ncbi:hypothetical protein GCM10011316_23500 [Roseibium aquae]|uniref:DUF6456 domain-containing protein n=1 Tax=Roseibium aquae TaxID=1323746 RepID=A0A916X2I7_9HYPH|nr:hypothetical protein GCM10011316_23500 [Roseibium aquae]
MTGGAWLLDAGGPPLPIPACQVQSAFKQDFLTPDATGAYVLSDAGRAACRRMLAGGAEAFPAQHRVVASAVIGAGRTATRDKVTVNLKESPLAWLASRRDGKGRALLSPAQVRAGERLRCDYTFANLTPTMAPGWRTEPLSRSPGHSPDSMSTDVLAARKRVYRVLGSLPSALSRVAVDICCHLKGLEDVERERGWPARSAKVVLQIALTALAQEYGEVIRAPERTSMRSSRGDG